MALPKNIKVRAENPSGRSAVYLGNRKIGDAWRRYGSDTYFAYRGDLVAVQGGWMERGDPLIFQSTEAVAKYLLNH